MVVSGNQVARIFLLYWKVCPRQLSLTSIKICSPRPPRIFANATASRIPQKMLTVVRIVLASMSKRPDCELAERTRDCLFERPCVYWINYTEPFYQESWILLPFKKEDIFSFEHRNGFYNASAKGRRNSCNRQSHLVVFFRIIRFNQTHIASLISTDMPNCR